MDPISNQKKISPMEQFTKSDLIMQRELTGHMLLHLKTKAPSSKVFQLYRSFSRCNYKLSYKHGVNVWYEQYII